MMLKWLVVLLVLWTERSCSLTSAPTSVPSSVPTSLPSSIPSSMPTSMPSSVPSSVPSSSPTITHSPTGAPTSLPSSTPSSIPTSAPSHSHAPTLVTQIAEARGSVTVDLTDACEPVEITIALNFSHLIYDRQHIFVSLSGFTSGVCTSPASGSDIAADALVFLNTSVDMSTTFDVDYWEGSWSNMYAESHLRIIANQDLLPDTEYRIVIDRINNIKRSCSRDAGGALQVQFKERGTQARFDAGNVTFLPTDPPATCYAYSTSLSLFPPMPDMYTRVTVKFSLSRDVTALTNVTLHLPGFNIAGIYSPSATAHNKWTYGAPRSAALIIEPEDAAQVWAGTWVDGDYADAGGPYFSTRAYFSLRSVDDTVRSGTEITLVLPTINRIAISCGRNINYDGFKLEMDDATGINNITATTLTLATQIGRGCAGANEDGYECNGRGVCNHCTQKCECYDGFGSASDKARVEFDTFAPDCSSKICPFGTSFGTLTTGGGTNNSINTGAHVETECSSRGICDRKYGTCTCLRGFTGAACQRRTCLGTPQCSGRGECRTMKQLASVSTHYPITTNTDNSRYNYLPILDGVTWDGESNVGCVCDSSWSVGLGDGETQQAEYFGPSCEFRRCPSGDDPTTSIDETDCENKSTRAYPGGPLNGLGSAGNKCHHDCSGRGICNYVSGVCSCFAGVTGANCGTLITSKDYTEIKGNDSIPLIGVGVAP